MALKIRDYAFQDKDVLNGNGSPKGSDLGQSGANQEAADWDIIIAQASNYSSAGTNVAYLAGMKAANPNLLMFLYMNTAFQAKAPGTSGAPALEQFWKQCPADGTEYLRSKWGSHAYLMRVDVDGGGWETSRINEAKSLINKSPHVDGVFMDVAGKTPADGTYVQAPLGTPYGPRPCPGAPYTEAQWVVFTKRIMSRIKSNIDASKMIFANGFTAGGYEVSRRQFDAPITFGLDEGFLRSASALPDKFPTESEWLNDLRLLGPLPSDQGSRAVAAMGMVKFNPDRAPSAAQFEQWREYGLATVLVGTDGGDSTVRDRVCFVTYRSTVNDMDKPSWYEWEIGTATTAAPTGTGSKVAGGTSGSCYKRVYTHGVVFCNPTTTDAVGMAMPAGTYKNKAGTTVGATVNVPKNTGLILFKTGGTTPSAPTTPTGLAAGTVTSSSVPLSWSASSDADGDLVGYEVERKLSAGSTWSVLGTTASLGWTANGLSASTAYDFRVRAYDSQSPRAYSGYSSTVTATTSAATDTTAPTVPGSVTATRNSLGILVGWTASTDTQSGMKSYQIWRRRTSGTPEPTATQIATPVATTDGAPTTSYQDETATLLSTYEYTVKAVDQSDNVSAAGAAATVTVSDIVVPTWPTPATIAYTATTSTITLTFPAASDDVGIDHYDRVRTGGGGAPVNVSVSPSASPVTTVDATVSANQSYTYTITPYDAAGNAGVPLTANVSTPSGGELRIGPIPL